jgi:transposase
MPKRLGITDKDQIEKVINEVKAAMRVTVSSRQSERLIAINMLLNSEKYSNVAKAIGRSEATIYNFARSYREGGIDNLEMHFSPGRPRKYTDKDVLELENALDTSTPQEEGYPSEMN